MPRSWKSESQKEFWERRKKSGLCVECQKIVPAPGKLRCAACLEKRRAIHRKCSQKRRDVWRANALCGDCGKPAVDDKTKCIECRDRRNSQWVTHRDKWKPLRKLRHQALKLEVFEAYGGAVCACCGERHMEFLSVDHVNNDGAKHRKEMGWKDGTGGGGGNIYGYLKTRNFPSGFRVLCMNCNFAYGHGGTCPHQERT